MHPARHQLGFFFSPQTALALEGFLLVPQTALALEGFLLVPQTALALEGFLRALFPKQRLRLRGSYLLC